MSAASPDPAAAPASAAAATSVPAAARASTADVGDETVPGARPLGTLARLLVLGLGVTASGFGMLGTLSGAAALMWLVPRLASGGWTVGLGAGAWYVGSVGLLLAGGCVWFGAVRGRAPARGALVAATMGAALAAFPGLVWLAFVGRHLMRGRSLPTGGAPGGLHDTLAFALPVLLAAAHGAALLALGRRLPRFAPGSARRLAVAWGGLGAVVLGIFAYAGYPRMLGPAPGTPTAEECNTILLDGNGIGGRWANLIVEWKDGLESVAPEAEAITLRGTDSERAIANLGLLGDSRAIQTAVPGLMTFIQPRILGLDRLDLSCEAALALLLRAGPAGRAAIPAIIESLERPDPEALHYIATLGAFGVDATDPAATASLATLQRLAVAPRDPSVRIEALSVLARLGPEPARSAARSQWLALALGTHERETAHDMAARQIQGSPPWSDSRVVADLVRVAEANVEALNPLDWRTVCGNVLPPGMFFVDCRPPMRSGEPCLAHLWFALRSLVADPQVTALLERMLDCPHPSARAMAAETLTAVDCSTPELTRIRDRALTSEDPVVVVYGTLLGGWDRRLEHEKSRALLRAVRLLMSAPEEPSHGPIQLLRVWIAKRPWNVDGFRSVARGAAESDDLEVRSDAEALLAWAERIEREAAAARAEAERAEGE